MDTELNYLGAAIFWLYIAAALLLSGVVIHTITTLPVSGNAKASSHLTDVLMFGSLACISFATLSYNMLTVLIQSFSSWSQRPVSLELLQQPDTWNDIWTWSTESALFQDFGSAIVASGARQYWTQAALVATMSVCLFMGGEGHRRGVPNLWAFFALAQVLPISFTQNLFYLTLLRLPQSGDRIAVPRREPFIMLIVYTSCLVLATREQVLLPSILTARVALFAPFILCDGNLDVNKAESRVLDGWGLQETLAGSVAHVGAWWIYVFSRDRLTLQTIWQSLFEHPAVSSLGCDLIICILSFGVWTWRTRSGNETPSKRDASAKAS